MNSVIKQYMDTQAINNSLLKALEIHPKYAYDVWTSVGTKKTPSLELGSLVDILTTRPDDFSEEYFITTSPDLTEKESILIDTYMESINNFNDDEKSNILNAREICKYQINWKEDTFLKFFNEKLKPIINERILAGERQIISMDMYNKAFSLVEKTKADPYLHWIFERDANEIYYQLPMYWEEHGVKFKALPDIVIETENETIVIDLKTYDSDFVHNYYKYKYYYQEAFYMRAIAACRETRDSNFLFLAVNTNNNIKPLTYNSNFNIIEKALNGGFINGKYISGIHYLINNALWHIKNNSWDYPMDYALDNNGYGITIM